MFENPLALVSAFLEMEATTDACGNEQYRKGCRVAKSVIDFNPKDSNITIVEFQDHYGAVIMKSNNRQESTFLVIGLDGWQFKMGDDRVHTAVSGSSETLVLGRVREEDENRLMAAFHEMLSKAEMNSGKDRHSANKDGGVQKTPSFIYAVLKSAMLKDEDKPELKPVMKSRGGFTDVGQHTGFDARDTLLPLVLACVRKVLEMTIPIEHALHIYKRFLANFHLWNCRNQLKIHKSTKETIDKVMSSLETVSEIACQMKQDGYWSDVELLNDACLVIRKNMEDARAECATKHKEQYNVKQPDLDGAESPKIQTNRTENAVQKLVISKSDMLQKSFRNLLGMEVLDVPARCTLDEMVKWSNVVERSSDAYGMLSYLSTIEHFFFERSKFLQEKIGSLTSLKELLESYRSVARSFRDSTKSVNMNSAVLYSNETLVTYIAMCMMHDTSRSEFEELDEFSLPLSYQDLSCLVLDNTLSVAALENVILYMDKFSKKEMKVFSGEVAHVNDTLLFAKKIASRHPIILFKLKEERELQALRTKNWFEAVTQKKILCQSLRKDIDTANNDLARLIAEKAAHSQHVYNSKRQNHVTNPDWLAAHKLVKSKESDLITLTSDFKKAQVPPPLVFHALPQSEEYGLQAMFFCHMPECLRILSQYCYECKQLTSKNTGVPDSSNLRSYLQYYESKSKHKSTSTPIELLFIAPDQSVRLTNVESISSATEGDRYPDWNQPCYWFWKGASQIKQAYFNPFFTGTDLARFTRNQADSLLDWVMFLASDSNSKVRGNYGHANQNLKPSWMSKPQWLAFCNLRSYPMIQLRLLYINLLNKELPLELESVHHLVEMVVRNVGSIQIKEGKVVQCWKDDLLQTTLLNDFARLLRNSIDEFRDTPKNRKSLLLLCKISDSLQFFDSKTFSAISRDVASVALGWADTIKASMGSEVEKEKELSLSYCNCLMIAVLAFRSVSLSLEDSGKILECVFRIGTQLNWLQMDLAGPVQSVLSVKFPEYRVHALGLVGDIIKKHVLPSIPDLSFEWLNIDNVYYSSCLYATTSSGDMISVNILNGIVLFNGVPPGFLENDIVSHALFIRTFGKTNFRVIIATSGHIKTKDPIEGCYYQFLRIGDDLIIEEHSNDSFLTLMDDQSPILKSLPKSLRKLYSCWFNDDYAVFRPCKAKERDIYYLYFEGRLRVVPRELRHKSVKEILLEVGNLDQLLLVDRDADFLKVFYKFEHPDYVFCYRTSHGESKVTLPRYQLSFLYSNGVFNSVDYKGSHLSEYQQLDNTLYGFEKYLLLKSAGGTNMIVMPRGVPCAVQKDGIDGHFATYSIQRDDSNVLDLISKQSDFLKVYLFSTHHRYDFIKAPSIPSRIQLAALYAMTGTKLPEEGNKMTGAEYAVILLKQAFCNKIMGAFELNMLRLCLELRNVPSSVGILSYGLIMAQERYLRNSEKAEEPLFFADVSTIYQVHHNKNFRLQLSRSDEIRIWGMSGQRVQKAIPELNPIDHKLGNAFVPDTEMELNRMVTGEARPYQPLSIEGDKFETEIAKRELESLKSSWESFMKVQVLSLKNTEATNQILDKVTKERADQEKLIIKEVESVSDFESKMKKVSNLLPTITKYDLVKMSMSRSTIFEFNPCLNPLEASKINQRVLYWMQLCVLEDRVRNLKIQLDSGNKDAAARDLVNQRTWSVEEHPYWLAFEVDQGIQIRPEQYKILEDIIRHNGAIEQLNMGMGKTRVILPCLYLHWSLKGLITRTFLLSNLIDEGYNFLHQCLCASVFERKLYFMPFSRDLELDERAARMMLQTFNDCLMDKGLVVTAPEHVLSFHLKTVEMKTVMPKLHELMKQIKALPYADIFDESDELLHRKRRLCFASGVQQRLPNDESRWDTIEFVLFIMRKQALGGFLSKLDAPSQAFNSLRFIGEDDTCDAVCKKIVNSLFDENESVKFSLQWLSDAGNDDKQKLMKIITDPAYEGDLEAYEEYKHEALLMLRGLFAHGILLQSLRLRYNVEYGISEAHKKKLAVPFVAAGVPSMRSEFAKPDCAILLTVLSYYEKGLKWSQVVEAFNKLLLMGYSAQRTIYREWYEQLKVQDSSVDSILKIDLSSTSQVNLLHHYYTKHMLVINFWLNHCVFPNETKVFPRRLMANAWNLTSSELNCGFSGTKDSARFLPCQVHLREAEHPAVRATDGKMAFHILNNARYEKLSSHDKLLSLAVQLKVDALLDAGALTADFTPQEIALKLLKNIPQDGVVFFDKASWVCLDKKGRKCNLDVSPIKASEAFVFFDQSKCRGADLKLKPNAVGMLALCLGMRKDVLMQAAGRLRGLDYGQKLVMVAPPEVDSKIREIGNCASVKMLHVLQYVLFNSAMELEEGLKHSNIQGLSFVKGTVEEDEIYDLKAVYLPAGQRSTLKDLYLPTIESRLQATKESDAQARTVLLHMKERLLLYGKDVITKSLTLDEECERELEQEVEEEQEKEIQIAKEKEREESDWIVSSSLPVTVIPEATNALSLANFCRLRLKEGQEIKWSSNVMLSENFYLPIVSPSGPMNNFLRPVSFMLKVGKSILVISEREANAVMKNGGLQFLSYLDNQSETEDLVSVKLFNGRVKFDRTDLLVKHFEPQNAASLGPVMARTRGQSYLYHRSELEDACLLLQRRLTLLNIGIEP